MGMWGSVYKRWNDRFGSTTDSGSYPQFRPLLGAKRKSFSGGWMSACSQKEKSVLPQEVR